MKRFQQQLMIVPALVGLLVMSVLLFVAGVTLISLG